MIANKDTDGEYKYKNQGMSIKVNFTVIKKEVEESKSIVIITSILGSFLIIKNMDTDISIGSIFPPDIPKDKITSKIIKEIGGEDYQMDQVLTKEPTAISM